MPLPAIPTSWTDLSMNWTDVHIAPYDPYFVAIAEAIKERAIFAGIEGNINPILLIPNPMYDINGGGYASAIQAAITLLIPEFPSTAIIPWTEETILVAIGAAERIPANYYMTAEWLNQQYLLLNELIYIRSLLAPTFDITAYFLANVKSSGNQASKATAISAYNSASFVEGGVGSRVIFTLSLVAGNYRVSGFKKDLILIDSLGSIPNGQEVDIYINYEADGTFVPLGHALEEDVYYLEAENVIWDAGLGYYFLTMPISPPDTATIDQFSTNTNGITIGSPQALYENTSFNFKP